MALAHLDGDHQSQALGTGLSIGVHVLIASLVLFAAFHAPRPTETPNVAISLIAPTLTRPGPPGRPGGSGMEAAAEPPRKPDTLAREVTLRENPLDTRPTEVVIPAMTVDAPKLLPGSTIDLETIGRGLGPGAGSEKGSGVGGPGPGGGPGHDGGFGGDGVAGGDGVTSPQLTREVRPNYTVDAMRAKVQGQVELEVVVMPDGTVDARRIRITRSLDAVFGLDAQAIEAVKQWRFRPGTQNNRPVPVRVRVELTFTLR
jgi:periplasmic protein TonB